MKPIFFDYASTTPCCPPAVEAMVKFATEDFANPASSHVPGQKAARAIHDARVFFGDVFGVDPEQVVFTGSGTESDNLAISGVAMAALLAQRKAGITSAPRVLCSSIEHSAVKNCVASLADFGIETKVIPVDSQGQIQREAFLELLTPNTVLVSIHQVNNIVGSLLPVEELAALAKSRVPDVAFHTDCVQAFGRVPNPKAPSPIDLVSISAHKVEGPKGVGALIVLNRSLLQTLRPLIWGGGQEAGLRSGTMNAGLVAAFQMASEQILRKREDFRAHATRLREHLRSQIETRKLPLIWNSPANAVPYIVNLSAPGLPSAPLARMIEERGYIVSTGSACHSAKPEPDPILKAMGIAVPLQTSALRVSFSMSNRLEDIDGLAQSIAEAIEAVAKLYGKKK